MAVRLRVVPALGRQLRASFSRRSAAQRLVAWSLALGGSAALTAGLLPLRTQLGLAGYLFLTLLIVVAAAVIGGMWPALSTVVIGFVAGGYFFAPPYESLAVDFQLHNVPLIAYLIVGVVIALFVRALASLAEEEASLRQVETARRRVATLVARGAPADELFAAVTLEVGRLLNATNARLLRTESDGSSTLLVAWEASDSPRRSSGDPTTISTAVTVDGRPWGVMTAELAAGERASRTNVHLERFTELLATAITTAQNRDQLAASRVRIVTAADDTRRRIERDLHDGAQQRLVSLALRLRIAQRSVPPDATELGHALSDVADELTGVIEELREMARGIHPAILAQGGLGPALRTLSRRSEIPVEIEVNVEGRLPDQVEVAAYYVVAETLTNVARHAHAKTVRIEASVEDGRLCLAISDDGVGGADAARGSGLTGLADRVQALGGSFTVDSPLDGGTRLTVALPLLPANR
jgi:signal transduction histidine kinase